MDNVTESGLKVKTTSWYESITTDMSVTVCSGERGGVEELGGGRRIEPQCWSPISCVASLLPPAAPSTHHKKEKKIYFCSVTRVVLLQAEVCGAPVNILVDGGPLGLDLRRPALSRLVFARTRRLLEHLLCTQLGSSELRGNDSVEVRCERVGLRVLNLMGAV